MLLGLEGLPEARADLSLPFVMNVNRAAPP
jgi:hypothetical protein